MLSLFVLLLACQEADKDGFSTSGTGVNPNNLGPTSSGTTDNGSSSSNDGGSGVGTGDLEAAENDDAPQISGVDAFFTEYEGQGDLIEVHVYYTDAQDDLEGGNMTLSYSNGETTGTDTVELEQSNASALLEDGEVTILFSNVDTSTDYQFRVRMQDAEGNYSNEYIATAPATE